MTKPSYQRRGKAKVTRPDGESKIQTFNLVQWSQEKDFVTLSEIVTMSAKAFRFVNVKQAALLTGFRVKSTVSR